MLGTRAAPAEVDPLIAAGPVLLVALPLLQAAAACWLAALLRRRSSRTVRWPALAFGVTATAATAVFAFVVVPSRVHWHVFTSWLLASSPDLAVCLWAALVLGVATLVLLTPWRPRSPP